MEVQLGGDQAQFRTLAPVLQRMVQLESLDQVLAGKRYAVPAQFQSRLLHFQGLGKSLLLDMADYGLGIAQQSFGLIQFATLVGERRQLPSTATSDISAPFSTAIR